MKMQLSGEEFVRASEYVETNSSSETTATLDAPETASQSPAADRASWIRVARTGTIATATNTPRPRAETPIIGKEPISHDTRAEIDRIVHAGESVPDVREDIVASLRERIESGTYFVGAETIAEMMIRRTIADKLR